MPIVTLIPPYDSFRGRIRGGRVGGGQVAYPVGHAHYSRTYTEPSNPESDLQVSIRSLMSQVAQAYHALSKPKAVAWATAAEGLTGTNAAGQSYPQSGVSLHNQINMYRLMDGKSLVDEPPALTLPGTVLECDKAYLFGTLLYLRLQHYMDTRGDKVFVRVTRPLGGYARQAQPSDYTIITTGFDDSVLSVSADPFLIVLPMQRWEFMLGDCLGVEVLPLGSTYYPGSVYRRPNMAVGVI